MKTQRKLHHRGYLLPYASRATATPVARPRHVRNLPKVYPPPYYTAVNPCHSRQEAELLGRGDSCPNSRSDCSNDENTRAFPARHTVHARTDSSLDSPRDRAVAPTQESPKGLFALHSIFSSRAP